MARTKAELILDLEGRGLAEGLTGSETKAELEALLEAAGEAPEVEEAEVVPPTAEEQAVIDAKVKMDEAKAVLDAATVDHKAAVEAHAAASAGPAPEPGKHIVVDGAVQLAPEGWDQEKPRRLNIAGRNVEHTHDTDSGVWCYRTM